MTLFQGNRERLPFCDLSRLDTHYDAELSKCFYVAVGREEAFRAPVGEDRCDDDHQETHIASGLPIFPSANGVTGMPMEGHSFQGSVCLWLRS